MAKWMKAMGVIGLGLSFLGVFAVRASGDSAQVLPKGVSRAQVTYNYYNDITMEFDPEGHERPVDWRFNANLNSNVFSGLSALDPLTGGPGTATIGRSVVNFNYEFRDLIIDYRYGLTDKLTVGVLVPYYWQKTNVKTAFLDTTNATVGKNPLFGTPGDPFGGAPLVPIAFGGVPLTTADVQSLLGPGLSINGQPAVRGFGYKPIQTVDEEGFSDIELGGRYQYYQSVDWRLAFTGGVRLPTGKTRDPDSLVAQSFGTGAWALLFRLNNDYTGIKDFTFNATFKYDLTLPTTRDMRVPDSADQVITANKENVDLNLGDVATMELSGSYEFIKGWTGTLTYRYSSKSKDSVSGNMGFNYGSLEDQTNWKYQLYSVELGYSTIPLYTEKKFAVPLSFSVSWEDVFAGSNNFLKQDFFSLKAALYF